MDGRRNDEIALEQLFGRIILQQQHEVPLKNTKLQGNPFKHIKRKDGKHILVDGCEEKL